MARGTLDFQTIRSEGGLLPPDLLRRVLDPKEKLDGTRPEDYGLPTGERPSEVITQSWNRLRKHWLEFRSACGEANGQRGMANGEWGMANGEWRMANGEWGIPTTRHSRFAIRQAPKAPSPA
jgi:hypothetical protein